MGHSLRQVVDILVQRTTEAKVEWHPTEERNALSVAFEGGTVVLVNHEEAVSTPWLNAQRISLGIKGARGISVELRNIDGSIIGQTNYTPEKDAAKFQVMQDLWDVAYDQAYMVTETYEALLRALNSPGSLGGEGK